MIEKIYDWDYTSNYHHGLSKDEYDTLKKNGRVWIDLNEKTT